MSCRSEIEEETVTHLLPNSDKASDAWHAQLEVFRGDVFHKVDVCLHALFFFFKFYFYILLPCKGSNT